MLEYSLIKQHQPRFNIRLRDDKSYPFLAVTLDDEWPRAMVMRGSQAQGRALLRALRPRLRHPRDARPAAAHVPDPHLLGQQARPPPAAGPALPAVPHREVLGPVRRRDRRRGVPTSWCTSCSTSSTATPAPSWPGSRREMREAADELEFELAARLRDRLESVRKAIDKQQMVVGQLGGPRRDRPRRGRPRGGRAGVLRAAGPGRGPQGLRARQGRGPRPRRAGRLDPRGPVLRPATARRAQAGAGAGRVRRPGPLRALAGRAARGQGDDPGAPAGRQAGAARDRDPQRDRGAEPAPPAPRLGPQQPGPGPQRAPGRPRPARGPAAHRVLRHEPHPGQRLRGLDGGARGRAAQEERVPPVQDPRGRRATTTSRPWRRCSPGGSPTTSTSASSPVERARRAVRLPAAAAAGRRRQGPARRGRAGARRARAHRGDPAWRRWPSGSRRSTCPAGASRSASPARARRCTCCSASATRPTASPSPTTASCGASA